MIRRLFRARMIIGLTLLVWLVVSPIARADDQFTISVSGASDSGIPGVGQSISVAGQSQPVISITITPTGSPTQFSQFQFLIDGIPHTNWTDPSQPVNYGWVLCSAGTVNATHQLTVQGVIGQGVNQSLSTPLSLTVSGFDLATSCGQSGSGGEQNTSISVNALSDPSTKAVTADLSLGGSLTASDLCANYNVWMMVKLHTDPSTSYIQKGTFCGPSSPNIQGVTWDTSQTAAGSYDVQAQALKVSGGPNIQSNTAGVTIAAGGVPTTGSPTTPGTGGTGTPGTGTGTTAPGSGLTKSPPAAPLIPLKFLVPDTSRLRGKFGTDLLIAVFTLIIDYALILVSVLAVVAFLYSGIMYSLSFGDQAKAEKAKKTLMWGVYGTVIVLMSVAFLTIISKLINTLGT